MGHIYLNPLLTLKLRLTKLRQERGHSSMVCRKWQNTTSVGTLNLGGHLMMPVTLGLGHMLLNTSHIEIFLIFCIQLVLCMDCQFMK